MHRTTYLSPGLRTLPLMPESSFLTRSGNGSGSDLGDPEYGGDPDDMFD